MFSGDVTKEEKGKVLESFIKFIDKFVKESSEECVLVGVPEEKSSRKEGTEINNAMLAYIHDKGSPLRKIPARPFMIPGIKKAQPKINEELLKALKSKLDKKEDDMDRYLNRAGLIAQNSIRGVISKGEGFAPLKESTKRARLRKRKYLKNLSEERKQAIMNSFRPLIDTGQFRNSITYVVKK